MGKGDRRTRKGKIWRGSTGKYRTAENKSKKAEELKAVKEEVKENKKSSKKTEEKEKSE